MTDKDERKEVLTNYMLLPEDENQVAAIYQAMDEWFERRSMELLVFMAKNRIECHEDKSGNIVFFQRNGEGLTKEQLFQNFL